MLKRGWKSVIDVSSVRDLAELLRIYREFKKSVDSVLKPLEELRAELVKPMAQPVEEEFKKTISSILYSWLTDLGNAKELQKADMEELYKKVKEHFK
ncbi:hypothetical protein HC235_05545 [Pyrobaculum arsenaticum]|uniref:Uncharacterized protein n=2 Tax=Pyrobaculum TaxID=2276 RepID=A0A7L4P928_9CREN|nr:hypothetical protein [Pyrobaculum arsenaticum]AFA38946.1 hypothetical protein Pogu_0919 [Pyrobaculum oguniense TE7]NYR15421.1 hypothetical protein [Pyrobaculum arsenaticum]